MIDAGMEESEEQIARYSGQFSLPGFGREGQERIRSASVLVVGAGGLGSPVIYYLAAAGVGSLTVIDDGAVEWSNLHRQVLHRSNEVGMPKVLTARNRVRDLNPDVNFRPVEERLTASNAGRWVEGNQVVVDGSDNVETKFLLNDVCVRLVVPLVHGGAIRFNGNVTTVWPGRGPCMRCLYADADSFGYNPREICCYVGVLGSVAGLIGTVQAAEAVKVILGIGEPLIGRMLVVDAWDGTFRTVRFERRADCPACGRKGRAGT